MKHWVAEDVRPNCRVLMEAGKWKVGKANRPKLLPPPREFSLMERSVDRSINPLNGMRRF